MSDIIPSINWEDFVKIVNAGRIAELKACEVLLDGEHPFTAIIFHGDRFGNDYVRTQAGYLALKSNITGGLDPEEVLTSLAPEPTQEQSLYRKRVAAMAHAREARKAKRELVKV